jgi:CheY-like chemotaxis protein
VADIVVIDDDARMRSLLVRVLGASGHSVRTAADGNKGLALFHEARPELIIVDIVMPNMEGIEAIRQLRQSAPSLPILAISGSGQYGYLRFAIELGATASLQKPFGSDEFLSIVSSLLAGPIAEVP